MSSTRPVAAAVFFSLFAAACAATPVSTPRIRVAQDLGCTAEQTTVQRLSEHRWQVSGCGRTATYVCTAPKVRDCWREGQIHDADARLVEVGQPQSGSRGGE